MKYTAGQAAKATGVATATITRALKNGRLSGHKDDKGAWIIEVSELHRVFPPAGKTVTEATSEQRYVTHQKDHEVATLERELDMIREALIDVRTDRDKWRDMAERLSLAPPSAPKERPRKPSFWTRVVGIFSG